MAYTIMCESSDRSGFARATLATREGMTAPVPALRPRPTLGMKDMGMNMAGMDMADMKMKQPANGGPSAMPMPEKDGTDKGQEGPMPMPAAAGDKADMAKGDMATMNMETRPPSQTHHHPRGPGVMNVAENPVNRLGERPLGLENEPHRVLVYTQLRSLQANPDLRQAGREIEIHLTGNMERYMWSFDGLQFSQVDKPIAFKYGERLRMTLVNDTMMSHPIHLHGMFFDLVTAEDDHKPRKHTIVVKPADKLSLDISANAPGDWAFHCHLLYHMHAGMMQVVSVTREGEIS